MGLKRLFSPFACLVWALSLVVLYLGVRLAAQKFGLELFGGSGPLLERARTALEEDDWAAAREAIQKVPASRRQSPEYLRILADYLKETQADPVMLSQVMSALASSGELCPEDFAWLCQNHLEEGRIEAARETLQLMPPSARSTLAVLKTEIAILRREGRLLEAAELESGLFVKFAEDPEVALNRALRDLDGTFPEIQRSALDRLWTMARRDDVFGLTALRLLARRTGHSLPDAERLLRFTEKHPSASSADRREVLSLIMRLAPEKRGPLIEAEIARFALRPSELHALAAWLAGEKEFDRMQQLLSKHPSIRAGDMFLLTAQGLAEQKRWGALWDMLKKGRPLPVSEARAATWRALAVRNLRPEQPEEVRMHLREAIRFGRAEKNTLALLAAARMSEEWIMPDLALEAYLVLAEQDSPQQGEMLEKCQQAANASKDEAVIEELARRLAKEWPQNRRFGLRHDYLRLLRGERLPMTAVTRAVERRSEEDNSPDVAGSLLVEALKAYRMDDVFLTVYFLRMIKDAGDLTIGERAVYAGLLSVACGEVSHAYQIAEKIHPEGLLEKEKAFLDMAL